MVGRLSVALLCLCICPFGAPADEAGNKPTEVYRTDLAKRIDIGVWSKAKTFKAPADGRNFLGPFGGQTSTVLTLTDLPKHKFVRIRGNLVLHKSADGNGEGRPDLLSIMIDKGPVLGLFTLCNPRPGDEPGLQSFPDEFPYGNHAAGTGVEKVDLGFEGVEEDAEQIFCPIDMIVPHENEEVEIKFYSSFRDRWTNEA